MTMIYRKTALWLFAVAAVGIISGCSGATHTAAVDEKQQYYDTYMDMPGEYDFGKPVFFGPGD